MGGFTPKPEKEFCPGDFISPCFPSNLTKLSFNAIINALACGGAMMILE
ncbi:uncharacterized protein METZ01_LOCUS187731 [marine metagenome]|uniref:Uncharacterized protein n=1 Tax=marine metagenome TaxID=408172 RepID=A0A382DB41_9ZZZZ